ncbi:MAG: beta-CASP ribonuclease aCPSF1 [Candidatus Micrarchaeota archaeon]|nr:beta-CASP ribonuclease aCPSF1 [Candidatus Micrarchaeota archaeon]MDE1804748.1 beta-CASP ribonuclease aCPSF1 [Candidatus Micrarchaeota archaeon]MDE1847210.1 beta-CASP ribonuclease aCPSF1 [Candidatus Micrarchaeota archaeon]
MNEEQKEKQQSSKSVLHTIEELIPKDAGFIKAEYEGPDIAIYVRDIAHIFTEENVVKSISATVKKKLIIRSEASKLMSPEEAKAKILEIVPKEAGVNEEGIRFVEEFSEVYLEALKPGLVIGKGGSTLKSIVIATRWVPRVFRIPTMNSDVIKGVRQMLLKESDFRKKFLTNVGKRINRPILKSEWIKATALGGFKEVGRSSLLLETNHSKVLIDCGLSPEPSVKGLDANKGSDENKAFPYLDSANITINDLDAVILTHAHMDHTGFVPYLFKFGYEGPVYCTPPTRDIIALLHFDYLKLVQRSGGTPLYDEKDVRKMLSHVITRDYHEVTNVTDEIKLTYHNAGHILGSSSVHLHIGEGMYNIVHSGDQKFGFTRLLDPADTKYPRIDSLFIEATNGMHSDITINRQEAEMNLVNAISRTIQNGGKVLIPLFAIGRAQEIMLVLESYFANNPKYKLEAPIYLDGMLLEASAIHTAYPEYLKLNLQHRILSNRSPFESEIFEVAKGERNEIVEKGPAVVLASGGMMNGGVSVEYFKAMSEDPKNLLLFVGYNSVSSLGRRIQSGLKEVPLPNEDGKLQSYKVGMQVHNLEGFSGHSDRRQLMSFVENIRPTPKKVFTMHGEESKCEDLARGIANRLRVEARAPMDLDTIRFK